MPHSPYCTGSDGHQEDPDIGVVVEFGEDCFPLGGVDVAVYSAKGDAFFVEEFAHEVEASSPEREDYAGGVVSGVSMVSLLWRVTMECTSYLGSSAPLYPLVEP